MGNTLYTYRVIKGSQTISVDRGHRVGWKRQKVVTYYIERCDGKCFTRRAGDYANWKAIRKSDGHTVILEKGV